MTTGMPVHVMKAAADSSLPGLSLWIGKETAHLLARPQPPILFAHIPAGLNAPLLPLGHCIPDTISTVCRGARANIILESRLKNFRQANLTLHLQLIPLLYFQCTN
jgi:hypothetical protein